MRAERAEYPTVAIPVEVAEAQRRIDEACRALQDRVWQATEVAEGSFCTTPVLLGVFAPQPRGKYDIGRGVNMPITVTRGER